MQRSTMAAVAVVAMALAGTARCSMAADAAAYRPTPRQEALSGAQRVPAQPQGRNAFPLLWSLTYDITPPQAERAYEADRAAAPAWAQRMWGGGDSAGARSFPYAAAKLGKPLPGMSQDDIAVLCGRSTPSCLAYVHEHADAVRVVLARHAPLLAKVETLAGYDAWWNTMPAAPFMPYAPIQPTLILWGSAAALRFEDGDASAGLSTACTAAATFRRMHARVDTQIDAIVTAIGARINAQLAADMFAQLPPATPVPNACRAAFAPPAASDLSLDAMAAHEWQLAIRMDEMERDPGAHGSRYLRLGWVEALRGESMRKAVLDDGTISPAVLDAAPVDPAQPAWVRAEAALRPAQMAALERLADSEADYVATLRMAALMLWLHDHPSEETLQTRLRAAPVAALDTRVSVGCDGTCLQMSERRTFSKGRTWPVGPGPAPSP